MKSKHFFPLVVLLFGLYFLYLGTGNHLYRIIASSGAFFISGYCTRELFELKEHNKI